MAELWIATAQHIEGQKMGMASTAAKLYEHGDQPAEALFNATASDAIQCLERMYRPKVVSPRLVFCHSEQNEFLLTDQFCVMTLMSTSLATPHTIHTSCITYENVGTAKTAYEVYITTLHDAKARFQSESRHTIGNCAVMAYCRRPL